MNTSEALDLSKENIQPLKQGRHAGQLGMALQAQTNAELHQKLLAEREQFELLIRMYEGDDPLKPHYDYVQWTEQSFPKHGPDSNLLQILENTLTSFKDDPRYKQDLRYAELMVKYIDSQPNPLEIYQLVYDQGLCTMCAPFYRAWAEEFDKINDIKAADRIYDLGIRVKALPLDLLPEAQMRYQLSVGRRILGYKEEPNDAEEEYNRQALHKLQRKNVYGERDAVAAPGRVRQQALANHNRGQGNTNAPFKVYQGDDNGCDAYSNGQGKMFPKQEFVNKENSLKPGPWTQHGGKHRSKVSAPINSGPAFQVHTDENADLGNGHPRTPSVPRALKPRKVDDDFTCALAIFEPPDPTKKPMYCKNKIYAGGREFQFEELRAALYNRRYEEQLAARRRQEEEMQKAENEATFVKEAAEVINVIAGSNVNVVANSEKDVEVKALDNLEVDTKHENKNQPPLEEQHVEPLGFKGIPLEANTSVFHCQSFTVNTKEAMNVVQEMWQSPTPSPAFGKDLRANRPCPVSPAGLDESGVFKVPIAPAPHSAKKSVPFPIFADDEPSPPPSPQPSPVQPLQTGNTENDQQNIVREVPEQENIGGNQNGQANVLLPFRPIGQSSASSYSQKGLDAATMKMLAFQSDSEEECDFLPKPVVKKVTEKENHQNPPVVSNVPSIAITAATPVEKECKKSFGPGFILQPPTYDEEKLEDMTCNTKAFDFALPSSTPLIGHFQSKSSQPGPNNINGSYIAEEVKKCITKQDLSVVFEASKERYSSSSGSNGSKTQGSVCTVANTSAVPPVQPEVLEKLAQISANKSIEELNHTLGLLHIAGPIDPFSTEIITQLLEHIGYPRKHHLIGLHKFETDAPSLHANSTAKLGNTKYSVIGELGKGAYARVLKASKDGQPVALKQQRPAWEWEWYIVQELQSRLPPNMMSGYLHMSTGYIYKNASILESEWAQYGSILSVVNKLKIAGKGNDLHLAFLFSIQFISIVEHLHKCKIIHGDIKPDNFVLFSLPSMHEPCVKLIDFGRSIDMMLFPADTTFTTVVTTDGFQCNEMKEGREWTYQTDLYGLAGSIYCVLLYDYMKVVKKDKKWQLTNKIPRYMMPNVWSQVFQVLLNVESCEELPDLTALRSTLEQHYSAMDPSTINLSITKLTNVLLNK